RRARRDRAIPPPAGGGEGGRSMGKSMRGRAIAAGVALALGAGIGAVSGCQGRTAPPAPAPSHAAAVPASTAELTAAGVRALSVSGGNGKRWLVVSERGGVVALTFADGTRALAGEPHGGRKRKYRPSDPAGTGAVVLEVKDKTDSDHDEFKLRRADGALLWK